MRPFSVLSLSILLTALAASPAPACPPAAALIGGAATYYSGYARQRTVVRDVAPTCDYGVGVQAAPRAPMAYAPETVRERVIEREVVPPPAVQDRVIEREVVRDVAPPPTIQERIIYRDVVRDPAPVYDPCPAGVGFAPAPSYSYSYGVSRQRAAFFDPGVSYSYSYGVGSAAFVRERSVSRGRVFAPAPVFAQRSFTQSRTVTRSRTFIAQ